MGIGLAFRPRIEHRQALTSSYTAQVTAALLATASGTGLSTAGLGAMNAAASFLGNCLAQGVLTPEGGRAGLLDARARAQIGRALIRTGEIVYVIDVDPLGAGHADPRRFVDDRRRRGPHHVGLRHRGWHPVGRYPPHRSRRSQVLHFRNDPAPASPWRGRSPLEIAYTTGKLAAALETRLGQEAAATVGHLLPVPQDPGDPEDDTDPMADLRADIRTADGATLLVETTSQGYGQGADRRTSPPTT